MVNCAFLTSFIFNSDKHIYEIDEMQFYVCVYVCIYAGTVLFLILPWHYSLSGHSLLFTYISYSEHWQISLESKLYHCNACAITG
jgi:hypothetical protein